MFGGVTTQTGTPRRPKLLAMESPLRFPPRTSAPIVSLIERTPVHGELPCGSQRFEHPWKLSDLSCDWFADEKTVVRSLAGNAAEQGARRVIRTNDKLHQRAEAPNGGRPQNVQLRHGRFKALTEPRVSLETTYGLRQLRRKELVFGNVHSVSSAQKNMIEVSFAAVIQADSYALVKGRCGYDGTS